MTAEREMTLHEWVGKLPEIHLARKELVAMQERIAALEAVAEAAEPIIKRYEWFVFNPTQQKELDTCCDALRAAGYLKGEGE